MAEQKTEVKPAFQFTFWKTRSWYKLSTVLLSWGLRWDTLLPQAGEEPKSQAQSTQSCWDFASTFPLLASFLHSSDKQRNNLLPPSPPDKVRLASQEQKAQCGTPKLCGLFLLPSADRAPCSYPCEHLQNLHPPDPLTILCQPVSWFLSSSPFPFSWGLTLWLNGKAVKCNSTGLGEEDRNT